MVSGDLDVSQPAMIYVETVNTGMTSNSYRFHEERALSRLHNIIEDQSAFREHVIWCMPVFLRPSDDWKLYTHALDRDSLRSDRPRYSRLDLQVLKMLEEAKRYLHEEHHQPTKDKFAIGGFSGAGEFAQRFSVLHPQALSFVVAGGIGGLPVLPIKEKDNYQLRYPVGVADFEELTGLPFDRDALRVLPRLLYYGSEDRNDPVKYNDAYDPEERAVVFVTLGEDPVERWLECIKIYEEFDSATETYVDEGVGHLTSKAMRARIYAFIAKHSGYTKTVDHTSPLESSISEAMVETNRDL